MSTMPYLSIKHAQMIRVLLLRNKKKKNQQQQLLYGNHKMSSRHRRVLTVPYKPLDNKNILHKRFFRPLLERIDKMLPKIK